MALPKAVLSRHAAQRLVERTQLAVDACCSILDRGFARQIGRARTARGELVDRLFFSPSDNQWYVALQDIDTGTVVTILTQAQYENHFPGHVSPEHRRNVMNAMAVAGEVSADLFDADNNTWPPVLVYVELLESSKPIVLGRWRGKALALDLRVLGRCQDFWAWVAKKVVSRGHQVDTIASVTARFSGGDQQEIGYAC